MSISQLRSNPNSFVLSSPHFLKEEKNKESDILFLSTSLVDQMMKIFITLTFNPATKKIGRILPSRYEKPGEAILKEAGQLLHNHLFSL
jgi:hypothetical protein